MILQKKRLKLGEDIQEADLWGLDCFTRKNVRECLKGDSKPLFYVSRGEKKQEKV